MHPLNLELHTRFNQFVNWYCSTKASKKYPFNDLDIRINKYGTFEVFVNSTNQKIYGRRK